MAQGKFTKSPTPSNIVSAVNAMVDDIAGKAASSHNHSASNITSGTLAVARGGTGVTANPSMLTNLGSTSAASVFAASPRPGVTGTLPIANGGTGANNASDACANIGALPNVGGILYGRNIKRNVDDDRLELYGGTDWYKGAILLLFGSETDHWAKGGFQICTSGDPYLFGSSSGALMWNGKSIETVLDSIINDNQGYIKYKSGVIIQWGTCWGVSDGGSVTFWTPFSKKPCVMGNATRNSAYPISITSATTSGFTWDIAGTSSTGDMTWIAIGG